MVSGIERRFRISNHCIVDLSYYKTKSQHADAANSLLKEIEVNPHLKMLPVACEVYILFQ